MFTHQREEPCWKAEKAALQPRCGGPQTSVQHVGLRTVSGCCKGLSGQACKYVALVESSSILDTLPCIIWIKEPP